MVDKVMIIHTVKSGDSIYAIAREYGVPPSRIITDNFLTNPGRLVVGQDLVILFPTQTHTVRGGDTLESIAAEYGVTINSLYRNNPILDGTPSIFPGQVLNIAYEAPSLGEISINGYAYPYIDRTVLRRTLPYLTYLSIFTYGIRNDGSLIPPLGGDEELIQIAREYGTVPLMMLTSLTEDGNFSNELVSRVLSDAELSNTVIANAVNTMREKGYGGIDVDFEYIGGELADAYTDFLNRLENALGEEFVLFVSLAPKNSANQPGLLYEGHDYPSIGQIADYTLLMTYEWGYTYGPPMAVSPINEVRRIIDYAVTAIPREKIMIGVPNYGYNWSLPYVRGESKAESLSNTEAVELAGDKNASILFDETAKAPFFSYYDRPQSYSDAVEHVVWFQNARSAEAMLQLVPEYAISGGSVWNIMRYFPSLWLVANSLFNIRKLG